MKMLSPPLGVSATVQQTPTLGPNPHPTLLVSNINTQDGCNVTAPRQECQQLLRSHTAAMYRGIFAVLMRL